MVVYADGLGMLDEGDESLARAVTTNQISEVKEYFRVPHGETRFSSDLLAIATRVSGPQMTELLVCNGFSMVSEDAPSVCATLDRVQHVLPNYDSPILTMLGSHPVPVSSAERCAALEIALDANAVRATDLAYVGILYGDNAVVDMLKRRNELRLAEPYLTLLTGEQKDPAVYKFERCEIRAVFDKIDDKELLHRLTLFSDAVENRLLRLRDLKLLFLERMCTEKLFMFCVSKTDLTDKEHSEMETIRVLLRLQNAEGLEYALRNNWAWYSEDLKRIGADVLKSKKYSAQIRTVILEDIERRKVRHQSTVLQGLQIEDPEPVRENWPRWDTSPRSDGTYRIVGYNGSDTVVTIPDQIDGVPVTSVSAYAFDHSDSDLPDQISRNRREVMCVEFPGTVKHIEGIRFRNDYHSRELERLILNEGSTSIDSFAFSDICIAEVRLPSTLEHIGMYAFNRSEHLRSIKLPGKLSFAGPHAFAYTGISKEVLPASLEKLSEDVFRHCDSLYEVTFSESLLEIKRNAFFDCSALEAITLPDSVTRIGSSAFAECYHLQNVTLGCNLADIGSRAFEECRFANLELPESVRRIGGSAFSACTHLKNIRLNEELEDIGPYAFEKCRALRHIALPDRITHLHEGVFNRCSSLETIKLPAGLRSIGEYAFEGCASLQTIEIPPTVETIGPRAFAECIALKAVIFNEGLRTIGEMAFLDCVRLDRLDLPTSVQSVGASVRSRR